MTSIKKPPAVMSDKVRRVLSSPERHSSLAISAAIKPPPAAVGLTAMARSASSLAAVLPFDDDSKEISLGTIAKQFAAAVEVCSGSATVSAAVPPDALQGIPLSDQEREDRAAGLTPEQAKHDAGAGEAR
jgi:hypothetical protein